MYFGGGDVTNESLKVVTALRSIADAPTTTVVLGRSHPHGDALRRAAEGSERVTVLETTQEMARLIAEADLGIGTCGGAAWERCALGLPTLVAISADNQRDDARILDGLGAVRNLGDAASVTVERWQAAIADLLRNRKALQAMSVASVGVMAGRERAREQLYAVLSCDSEGSFVER